MSDPAVGPLLPVPECDHEKIRIMLGLSQDEMQPRGELKYASDLAPCDCGHKFGFSDMVRVAIESGVHGKNFLRKFFNKEPGPIVHGVPFTGIVDCPDCGKEYFTKRGQYQCAKYQCQ
ncbi:hypothetical protein HDV00_010000 [Rhizophlyctis rosea]|nr:hypothetical protein HDV00_010000 [Rhizophlyctis rosea]